MALVAVALCVLGALVLVNLLLSLGLVRRLRRQDELIATLRRHDRHPSPAGLPNGSPVPEFATVTTDGRPLSHSWLTGQSTAIGFIAGDCPSCEAQLTGFVDVLNQRRLEGGRSLIVLVQVPGMQPETEKELRGLLEGLGTLTTEPLGGPIQTAFRVKAYPAFVLVDQDATVVSCDTSADALLAGEPAKP